MIRKNCCFIETQRHVEGEAQQKTFCILSVVHPLHHKGMHILVEVLSILKKSGCYIEFTCQVVGWYNKSNNPSYIEEVERKILEYDLCDHINFVLPTVDIKNELEKADLYVHPSLNESFGYILAEAMAFELPVVAFEVGGIREVVSNNVTGLLIPPYDYQLMSNAISTLIFDTELRNRLGKRGRERVECLFEINNNMRQLFKELNL